MAHDPSDHKVCGQPGCEFPSWCEGPFCPQHLVEAVNTVFSDDGRAAFWDRLEVVLQSLTYKEREVVKLRYGLGDGYSYTPAEVGRIFKEPVADIRATEEAAARKLLHPVRVRALRDLFQTLFEPHDFGSASSAPGVLLQSVVIPGKKTDDGCLIEAVKIPWFMIMKMIEKDPSVVHQISPRKWEELIAGWYSAAGFDEVTLTPHSGDLGRDVIAVKTGLLTVRVIDQVKAYAPGHLVPANDVRALLGVLQADRAATKGFVTTTSDFAPLIGEDKFIAPFIPYRLELVNGVALLDRLKNVANKTNG